MVARFWTPLPSCFGVAVLSLSYGTMAAPTARGEDYSEPNLLQIFIGYPLLSRGIVVILRESSFHLSGIGCTGRCPKGRLVFVLANEEVYFYFRNNSDIKKIRLWKKLPLSQLRKVRQIPKSGKALQGVPARCLHALLLSLSCFSCFRTSSRIK